MTLAHYLLQVNIYLILFYALYKILLARETYFVLNRVYLIGAACFSLLIPFIQIDWFKEQAISQKIPIRLDQLDVMVGNVVLQPAEDSFNWGGAIVTLYVLGIVFMILKLIFKLIAVKQAFKFNDGSAFSFLKHKVIDENLPNFNTIDTHEDVHIKQYHTLDILFFEALGIINWFNPVMYFYKHEIKDIHEYLADEVAATYQGDKEIYALLLLSQAFGVNPEKLTNGFFTKSMIKKRIYMLHKQRSRRTAILKYGLSVPLFAIALLLSSSTIRDNKELLAVAEEVPMEKASAAVDYVKNSIVFGDVIDEIEKSKTAIANDGFKKTNHFADFYTFLKNHISYPQSAAAYDIEGTVVSEIEIKNGSVAAIKTKQQLGYGIENEILKCVSKYNGDLPEDGFYELKTAFILVGEGEQITKPVGANIVVLAARPKKEEKVYNFVSIENPPTYPEGLFKFYDFLGSEIKYPAEAARNNIQGNVFISFIVETDGSLNDIKVERGLGYGTDEEAVRVLKMSKKWNPGMVDGVPVRVKYNIPIKFSITEEPKVENTKTVGNIKLRGILSDDKKPIYVLNGDIITAENFSKISADDIESVTVLKDASAIISYGTRAKDGVVSIKTKNYKPKKLQL